MSLETKNQHSKKKERKPSIGGVPAKKLLDRSDLTHMANGFQNNDAMSSYYGNNDDQKASAHNHDYSWNFDKKSLNELFEQNSQILKEESKRMLSSSIYNPLNSASKNQKSTQQ